MEILMTEDSNEMISGSARSTKVKEYFTSLNQQGIKSCRSSEFQNAFDIDVNNRPYFCDIEAFFAYEQLLTRDDVF